MKNFTYYRPKSTKEAVALLDSKWGTAELLAGGTDLLDLQKEYIAQPDKVISLSGVTEPGLTAIGQDVGPGPRSVKIGARVSLDALATDKNLHELYPALTTAAGLIGGPQIRNMGTLGGNLCQRNRCWYFRDEHVDCLLKGGEYCFALNGDNRYHAVFAKGHKCVIVHPSTLAPVLIALDAEATYRSPQGLFPIKLSKFFKAPSAANEREHVLAPNQMLMFVEIPMKKVANASYEVRHKQSHDWPLVQAAVAFAYDGGKAKNVKIVLGHVAPTPLIVEEAGKLLEGKAITEETAAAAGDTAAKGATPLSQNAYKVKLIAVAVKRALLTAAGAKKYWEA